MQSKESRPDIAPRVSNVGVAYKGERKVIDDMRKSTVLVLFAFLVLAVSASPQGKSDKFAVFVTGLDDAAPITQSLIKKLNASKPFEAVGKDETAKVVVLISCMPHKPTDPFVCMYVSHYNGATSKTFLGGGMWAATSADAVSDNFLGSIAQDIVERFDDTSKDNLREALQACLLMTDSKCNVPDPLQKEFNAKQLTLGQYLLKKNQ
jgi:hypothetical protein